MTVTYLIDFEVRPGRARAFLDALNPVLDAMRREPSFREAVLHRSPDNELRFLLYETWADHQEVLEVQLARPYRQAWHAALPELLARPRDIAIWTPLRADRQPPP